MVAEASITQLLAAWRQGDQAALAALAPRVYRELLTLARTYLRRRPSQTLQPTALVNEAWLRLIGQPQLPQWESRAHFFGVAARLMRLVLVDYARMHHAAKRQGGRTITLQESIPLSPTRPPDVLEVHEALDQLEKVDERKARVIELRYFGGMEREEIAAALDLTVPTVKRDLRLAEAWLRRFLLGEKLT
jgi:RNA polymerase sigma-70 factor (ECF subfamily)